MQLTAPHTWGKYAPDKIFAVVSQAVNAKEVYGKEKVVNGAPGTFLDDKEVVYCLPTVEKIYRNLPVKFFT